MASRTMHCLLVVALLFAPGVLGEEDYFYDEEEAEVASTHVPKFISQPTSQTVKEGDTVILPCLLDKLSDVIIWKSEKGLLFTSSVVQTKDSRYKLEEKERQGSNLVIENVTVEYSGTYECQVTSSPPVSLQHTVIVSQPPTITTRPESGVLVEQEGKQITLACKAEGSPEPTVTWTKKGGLLPYGEKKHAGEQLVIAAVESTHTGDYICTADNGVGEPAVRHIRLEINFAPQITVTDSMVHTGAGYEAQMECNIQGQPMPQVEWYRVKGTPLDETHYQRYQDGHLYGIRIDSVRDSDLGYYSCQASNELGKLTAMVQLTGKPKPVVIRSEPNGNARDMYTLRWSVESYAPILEYKILYKRVQEEAGGAESQWKELVAAYPGRTDNSSVVYKLTRVINDLQPASVYEAIVTASNKYGWSDQADHTFRFSTLGANGPAADLKGGEALVGENPTGAAVASRAGVTFLLATLLALIPLL